MKTTSTQWPRLLTLLSMSILLNACGDTVNRSDKGSEERPVIEAKIGDTWDEVKHHSTLKVGELHFGGSGTIINAPHNFIYRDARHYMQLDNVGYVHVSMNYEKSAIGSLGISPYRESGTTDETWRRLQDIIHKMEQAGWIPDDDKNKRNPASRSAQELRNKYINLPGGARGEQKGWYDEFGNEAWIELVKTMTGRPLGEDPTFNIVLQIRVAAHPSKPKAPKQGVL